MDAIKNWGKGHYWITGHISKLMLSMSDWIYEYFDGMRRGSFKANNGNSIRTDSIFPPCDFPRWQSYYRNNDKLWSEILQAFDPEENTAPIYQFYKDMQAGFAKIATMPQEELAAQMKELFESEEGKELLKESFNLRKALEEDLFQEIDDDINGKVDSEPPPGFFESQAMHFLLKVWMPCFILYRELPGKLLRKARLGDNNALCDLLRIDKTVQFDKRIQANLVRMMQENPAQYQNRIVKAQAEPFPKIKKKQLKIAFGSMVSRSFEKVDPVNAPELQNLFDVFTQAKSGNAKQIDTDIQTSPEAFAKAIQRDKDKWAKVLKVPGQK